MYCPQVDNQSLCIFIACREVNSYLCLRYFWEKDEEFKVFRLRLAYRLIHSQFWGNSSEKDNLESLRKWKKSIIWRQHLPMKRDGGCHNRILVKIFNTSNTSVVETNAKKVRKRCTCDPDFWLCNSCHTCHVMEKNN